MGQKLDPCSDQNCIDPSTSHNNCGMCGNQCSFQYEVCDGGSCVCKPGFTLCNGNCVDTQTSSQNCGMCGNSCMGQPCGNGMCLANCNGFPDQCNNSCTDTNTDPNNCGDCGQHCNFNEICYNGNCRNYEPAPGCGMCPCPDCNGDLSTCCEWDLLGGDVICTEANGCPP